MNQGQPLAWTIYSINRQMGSRRIIINLYAMQRRQKTLRAAATSSSCTEPSRGSSRGAFGPPLARGEGGGGVKSLPVTHTTRLSSLSQGARTSVTSSQRWTTQQREAEKSIPDPPALQGRGLTAGADPRLARKKPGLSEKGRWLPPAPGLMPAAARDRLSWGPRRVASAAVSLDHLLSHFCVTAATQAGPTNCREAPLQGWLQGEMQAAEICFFQRDVRNQVLLKNSAKDEPPYQGHSVTLLPSCLR